MKDMNIMLAFVIGGTLWSMPMPPLLFTIARVGGSDEEDSIEIGTVGFPPPDIHWQSSRLLGFINWTMARRYDSSTTTFSPEGRLHQVEYAIEAINNAGTSVGILAKNGVVMASEKKITSGLLAQARVSQILSMTYA